jgi:putative iron-regulated protein
MTCPSHSLRRATAPLTFAVAPLLILGALGCSESVTAPVLTAPSTLVAEIVNTVYLPTLDTLATRCAQLNTALQTLATAPSTGTLQAAQTAWRAARIPYERGEAFAFGPVETGGYDPAMDTWPVSESGIDALIAGATPITPGTISQLDGTLTGFHGIEYVLFGLNGATTVSALTPRALAYLTAAGQTLSNDATALQQAWAPSGGNFSGQLISAGTTGSIYTSQGAALQEVIGGMVDPTEEIASSKIAQPLQTGSSQYEESRFSNNTLADLRNDLTGVQEVYFGGDSTIAGRGISALVVSVDPQTDRTVRTELTQAFAALDAITPNFDAALHTNPALLRTAQQAILTLNQTLAQHVVPLVGSLEE